MKNNTRNNNNNNNNNAVVYCQIKDIVALCVIRSLYTVYNSPLVYTIIDRRHYDSVCMLIH